MPFKVSLFPLFKYLVKTSIVLKKHFNPSGGGGHQVMDSGLVLLCNSTKTVLAKLVVSLLCMMASTLNKRMYKERRKRPKKKVSLFSTNMIKTVVNLFLFIENKELSFNIGL